MGRKKKYYSEEERLDAKKKSDRESYLRNKTKIKEKTEDKKVEIKEYQKNYRIENDSILKLKKIVYYNENKDNFAEYGKIYRVENKDKIRLNKNKYQKDKRETDSLFKIRTNISGLIRYSIKRHGFKKKNKTEDILGCSFEEFKIHLESQFEDWMNWDNYGNPKDGIYEPNKTWDIDHIIPTSSAINEGELMMLNQFTNLQPLCSYNNRFVKVNN